MPSFDATFSRAFHSLTEDDDDLSDTPLDRPRTPISSTSTVKSTPDKENRLRFVTPSPEPRKRRRISVDPDSADRFIPSTSPSDVRLLHDKRREALETPTGKRKRRLSSSHRPSSPTRSDQAESMMNGNARKAFQRYGQVLASVYTPGVLTEQAPHSPGPSSNSLHRGGRVLNYFAPSLGASPSATRTALLDSVNHSVYNPTALSYGTRKLLTAPAKLLRNISTTPYRVLDAPDIEDNFYLNLVDWSARDQISVVLGPAIYMYNVVGGKVEQLDTVATDTGEISDRRTLPSSIKYYDQGKMLAVGNRKGDLILYDVETKQSLVTVVGHTKRIGSIGILGPLVATGSADSTIILRDIRVPRLQARRISAHSAEVCGLRFSAFDEPVLASGGDDCKLFIWDLRSSFSNESGSSSGRPQETIHRGRLSTTSFTDLATASPVRHVPQGEEAREIKGNSTPLLKFHEHRAAVKALAWSPHQRGVLVSGGGKQDPIIRFWNTRSGTRIDQFECEAQVTNLEWSQTSDEIVSTHGYGTETSPGVVTVWHYPSRTPNVSFVAHTDRVLYLAMSPNGQSIATASGDQTLRFFNVFPEKPKEFDERGSDLVVR